MKYSIELNTKWIYTTDLQIMKVNMEEPCPFCGVIHKELETIIRGRFFNRYYTVECPNTKKEIKLNWS